jgi:hypothetical protein
VSHGALKTAEHTISAIAECDHSFLVTLQTRAAHAPPKIREAISALCVRYQALNWWASLGLKAGACVIASADRTGHTTAALLGLLLERCQGHPFLLFRRHTTQHTTGIVGTGHHNSISPRKGVESGVDQKVRYSDLVAYIGHCRLCDWYWKLESGCIVII